LCKPREQFPLNILLKRLPILVLGYFAKKYKANIDFLAKFDKPKELEIGNNMQEKI